MSTKYAQALLLVMPRATKPWTVGYSSAATVLGRAPDK